MEILNIATWDRLLRVGLGVTMLIIGWHALGGPLTNVLRVVALYPLVTGLAGWCPIYALLSFRTRRR